MESPSFVDRVFALQNQIVPRYVTANLQIYTFITDAIEMQSEFDVSQQDWESIPVEMRSLFNFLHADALSTLLSALRVALHGCDTDALALCRVVLENLTILDYISSKQLHHSAFVEIHESSSHGKSFSDRFTYETAIKQLGYADDRNRLRGQMSTLGSHASPARLSLALVRRAGEDHLKAGVALDNPKVSRVLNEIARLALFGIRVVRGMFGTYLTMIPENFDQKCKKIEADFEALQKLAADSSKAA
jgi:hypothetical protein